MKKFFLIILIAIFFSLNKVYANTYNVAFTIDNNYPIYTLLVINSILKNNISNNNYNFYVVENNITNKNKTMMKKFVDRNKQNLYFIHIDTSLIDGGTSFFQYKGISRITRIAMARIILADILPKDIHKILYLDSDTLVNIDLSELFETDMKNCHTAMVLNHSEDNLSNAYKFKNGYYNSGVILMDLDKWHKQKLSQKLLNYLNKNKELFTSEKDTLTGKKFVFADQDLINIVFDGQIKKLPNKWNNQSYPIKMPYLVVKGNRSYIKYKNEYSVTDVTKPSIIHYLSDTKPWLCVIANTPSRKLYFKYWNKSELVIYRPYVVIKLYKKRFITLLNIKRNRVKCYLSENKK